jgi:hypothetical protein
MLIKGLPTANVVEEMKHDGCITSSISVSIEKGWYHD